MKLNKKTKVIASVLLIGMLSINSVHAFSTHNLTNVKDNIVQGKYILSDNLIGDKWKNPDFWGQDFQNFDYSFDSFENAFKLKIGSDLPGKHVGAWFLHEYAHDFPKEEGKYYYKVDLKASRDLPVYLNVVGQYDGGAKIVKKDNYTTFSGYVNCDINSEALSMFWLVTNWKDAKPIYENDTIWLKNLEIKKVIN